MLIVADLVLLLLFPSVSEAKAMHHNVKVFFINPNIIWANLILSIKNRH